MYKYSLNKINNPETGKEEERLFCDSILTNAEIRKIVIARIRQKYTENEENKMQRLGILDSQNIEFLNYNKYVEECRAYGDELKAQSLSDIEAWSDYQRKYGEDEKNYIERLKKVGLVT